MKCTRHRNRRGSAKADMRASTLLTGHPCTRGHFLGRDRRCSTNSSTSPYFQKKLLLSLVRIDEPTVAKHSRSNQNLPVHAPQNCKPCITPTRYCSVNTELICFVKCAKQKVYIRRIRFEVNSTYSTFSLHQMSTSFKVVDHYIGDFRSIRWSSHKVLKEVRHNVCLLFSKTLINVSIVGDLHIVEVQSCSFALFFLVLPERTHTPLCTSVLVLVRHGLSFCLSRELVDEFWTPSRTSAPVLPETEFGSNSGFSETFEAPESKEEACLQSSVFEASPLK